MLELHSGECHDSLCDTQDNSIEEVTWTMSRLGKASAPRNHLKTPSRKEVKKNCKSFTSPATQARPSKSKIDEKHKHRYMCTLDTDECTSQVEKTPDPMQVEVTPQNMRRTPPYQKAKQSPHASSIKTLEEGNT